MLKQNTREMEQIRSSFRELCPEVFTLEKLLRKEFEEMDSTKIIVQCPQHITLFSLNLRKEKEAVPK